MLCQTTNPLAKCMDQIQEDMENMHKELNFWNTEKKTFATKHREEERYGGTYSHTTGTQHSHNTHTTLTQQSHNTHTTLTQHSHAPRR